MLPATCPVLSFCKMTVQLLSAEPETVSRLRAKLLDPNTSLPEKYRVLFSLRNLAGKEAHEALLTGGCDWLVYLLATMYFWA